jgi:hypothetical protein
MTITQPSDLRSGDVLVISRSASVQFIKRFLFRLIKVHDRETYQGWCWIDGYVLNERGDAVERRSLFVQFRGLDRVARTPAPRTRHRPAAVESPCRAVSAGRP